MILANKRTFTHYFIKKIDELIQKGEAEKILHLVPTNRKARALKKELIDKTPQGTVSVLPLETLFTLAEKLFEVESPLTMASEAASSVLLKKAFQTNNLIYFKNYAKIIPNGTLERLKRLFSEYKRHGITSDFLLHQLDEKETNDKQKFLELAEVYKNYCRLFTQLHLYEIGDVLREISQLTSKEFSRRFRLIFPSVETIYIAGYSEFTNLEIELLAKLGMITKTTCLINFDYDKNNPELFSTVKNVIAKLEGKKFYSFVDDSEKNSFASSLAKSLFLDEAKNKSPEATSKIFELPSATREEEIKKIAKRIKYLLTEQKIPANEISVAFHLVHNYSALIRDTFTQFGIPFNLTDRFALHTFNPVITVINLLEVISNDFYYKSVFRVFSSAYYPTQSANASDIVRVASKLRILSGYETWISRLDHFIEGNEETEDEILSDKNLLLAVKKELMLLHSRVKQFFSPMTFTQFSGEVVKLISGLEFHIKILALSKAREEENIKSLTTFLEMFTDLFDQLQNEYEGAAEEKFSIKSLLSYLKTATASTRFNIKEKPGYGVLVSNFEELRGLHFPYLFMGGMCDGDFPTRFSPEIFSYESYNDAENRHIGKERYLFYQTLLAANKQIALSYPLHEGTKKELSPSAFLFDLKKVMRVSVLPELENPSLYSFFEVTQCAAETGSKELLFNGMDKKEKDELETKISLDKKRREVPFEEFSHNGFITESSLSTEKLFQKFSEGDYSISQLELYAKCPFQFYLKRILKLTPLEEPTEDLEPMEMGLLLHDILEQFMKTVKERGVSLSDKAAASTLLFKIAEKKIDELSIHSSLSFWEKEKILGVNGNRNDSILSLFLEYESSRRDGFEPEYFEIPFGRLKGENGETISVVLQTESNARLRGKIDRIDVNREEQLFKVFDYKLSGKKPTEEDLSSGLSLQIPLYLHAAEKILNELYQKEFLPAAGLIYSLKFNNDEFGPKQVKIGRGKGFDEADAEAKQGIIQVNGEMIANALIKIDEFIKGISTGKFNLSKLENREEKVCRYCSFRSVCRVQEVEKA